MIKRPERNYDQISSPDSKEYTVRKFHLQNHLQDDLFQIFSSLLRNCIVFFYVFLYFPSFLVTFVFYISQLKFESYHRYMTGRPKRIILHGDVNNRKSAELLDLLGSPAESFLPASMWNILWKFMVVFSAPIRQNFSIQTFNNDKTSNASGGQ